LDLNVRREKVVLVLKKYRVPLVAYWNLKLEREGKLHKAKILSGNRFEENELNSGDIRRGRCRDFCDRGGQKVRVKQIASGEKQDGSLW